MNVEQNRNMSTHMWAQYCECEVKCECEYE